MNKKLKIVILFLIMIIPNNIFAYEREEVKFSKCIDGDTARFIYNNEEVKFRFLVIDTPETKHPTKGLEPFGKEASNYTCNKIKNAKKIEIEFDNNSEKKDKYDRYLAWVYVDDSLIQAELVKNGLAELAYLYGDYKYIGLLKDYEVYAQVNKLGIYSQNKPKKLNTKTNKIVKHSSKYYIKKIINKIIDNIFDN